MQTLFKNFRERSSWQAIAALVVYAVSTLWITWPLTPRLGSTLYNYGDALVHAWKIGWNAHQLLNAPFNLYQTPAFYPYSNTLAFSNNFFTHSLVALPVVLATGNYALGLNLNVWLAFLLNGLGMYLLLRDWKMNFAGSLVGGFIFAFGHFHLNQISHLALLSTQWLPFTLLYFNRSLRAPRARYFVLFGIFLWLSVNVAVYYAFFTAAVLLVYGALALVRAWGRFPQRVWLGLGATGFIVFLLTIPLMLPYLELSTSLGLKREYNELLAFQAVPSSYLSSMSRHEPFVSLAAVPRHAEAKLSPGLFALLLGLYGLVQFRHRAAGFGFVAIALVGLGFSFGLSLSLGSLTIPMPYQFLYDRVPGIATSMRVTARWGMLVLFGVAGIAGIGFGVLTEKLRGRYAALGCTLLLLLGMVLEYDQSPAPLVIEPRLNQPASRVYEWLKAQALVPSVELPMSPPDGTLWYDAWYQYNTLMHYHPIVNGSAGFMPPTYYQVFDALEHFPSADAIDVARALDLRHIIVHTTAMDGWSAAQARADLFPEAVKRVAQFGDDWVYEITPHPSPAEFPIELRAPPAAAPNARMHAFLVATPSSPQHQLFAPRGIVTLMTEWHSPNGAVAKSASSRSHAPLLLTQGRAVIPFEINTPPDSGAFQFVVRVEGLIKPLQFEQTIVIQKLADSAPGPEIQLQEAHVSPRAARGRENLTVTLFWRTLSAPSEDYDVFVHILDADGATRAQANVQPYGGALPTRDWAPGETIVEQYLVPIPGGLPQGAYSVVVGMADPRTHEPVPVRDLDDSLTDAIALDMPAYIGKGWSAAPLKPMFPASVDFGDWVRFAGYDLQASTFARGAVVPLNLYWVARERTATAFTLFVHLINDKNELVAQADAPPLAGSYPTSAWNDAEWVRDAHPLTLPSDLPAGDYTIEIGWYDSATGARVPLQSEDTRDFLRVAKIHVKL